MVPEAPDTAFSPPTSAFEKRSKYQDKKGEGEIAKETPADPSQETPPDANPDETDEAEKWVLVVVFGTSFLTF